MLQPINFATNSYRSESLPLSAQRAVNAYAEIQPKDAKTPVAMFGAPGAEEHFNVGRGPIRGLFEMNGILYAVSRDEFWSITSAGVTALLGTGITGLDRISMDGNGTQIVIVNGELGFVYNASTGVFVQISDADFNAANTVTFIDGYFVFDWLDTNKFFLSDLLDGTSYDALSFASAESKPDRVIAVRNRQGILLIFGEKSIEAWDNTGAVSFPFQRFDGATVNRGLAAPLATAEEDNSVFFLGEDRMFYRLNGTQPVRVSTHAIERTWQEYSEVGDAFCFPVNHDGHKWIVVTFPTENSTWAYDIATQRWHERISWNATGAEARWRMNCSEQAFGDVLVGDANSGRIGHFHSQTFTEFGDPIRMILTAPPLHANGQRVFMSLLEVDMETGVGLTSGQGSDPQAMLEWSDDGGRTWSALQPWQSMGKIGAYTTRLRWKKLGSFYQRTLRLTVTDPVKRVVLGARADLTVGV